MKVGRGGVSERVGEWEGGRDVRGIMRERHSGGE